MRLLAAIAALTIAALPAHAQRVDTRQIDIRETASGRTCSFNAYPDITLIDTRKGRDGNIATWRKSARGLPAKDTSARMELIFGPAGIGEGKWMTPPVLGLGITIRADATLTRESVAGARLSIDGEAPIALQYNASRTNLIFAVNRDADTVAHRMIEFNRKTADLEILDANGGTLRRYSFDISRLNAGVEVVSIVGWTCDAPS
jgi:hypothetical protein